jgi:hypothetical protein
MGVARGLKSAKKNKINDLDAGLKTSSTQKRFFQHSLKPRVSLGFLRHG